MDPAWYPGAASTSSTRESRSSSPSKRFSRPVSPSPSVLDSRGRGDRLPEDSFSPEPPRPRQRAESQRATDSTSTYHTNGRPETAHMASSPGPSRAMTYDASWPGPSAADIYGQQQQLYTDPSQVASTSSLHHSSHSFVNAPPHSPTKSPATYDPYQPQHGQYAAMQSQPRPPAAGWQPSPISQHQPPMAASWYQQSIPPSNNPLPQSHPAVQGGPTAAAAAPRQPPPSASSGSVRRSLPQPPGASGTTRPPPLPPHLQQAPGVLNGAFTPPLIRPPSASVEPQSSGSTFSPDSSTTKPLPATTPVKASMTTRTPASPVSSIPSSPISRSDSVRLAAEELMSRGSPRRGGSRFGLGRSRLGHSGSADSVTSTYDTQTATSESDSSQPVNGNVARQAHPSIDEAGLQQQFEALSTVDEPSNRPKAASELASDASIASNRATDPSSMQRRPAQAGPEDVVAPPPTSSSSNTSVHRSNGRIDSHPTAPTISVEPPLDIKTMPPSSVVATPDASSIPKIFSPPPNAAPPIPSFTFSNDDDEPTGPPSFASFAPSIAVAPVEEQTRAPAPTFSFSGPDDEPMDSQGPSIQITGAEDDTTSNGPMISISGPEEASDGPVISISGPDEEDLAEPPSGMTPSVSLSHTADHAPAIPQRASATTSQAPRSAFTPASQQQNASSVAGATCGHCSKYIIGPVVQALEQSWHPGCFSCNHCGELLEHVAFYEHQGRAYCHFDYHELFSLRCFHCRTPIVDERFIKIEDEELVSAKSSSNPTDADSKAATVPVRYYHDLHFFCANCGDPFIDPKVASSTAGSERGKIQVDERGRVLSGGKAFVVWKGYPYCEGCHHSLHKPRCKGCRKPILYDVITALRAKWHPECFVCTSCQRPYEDDQVFVDSKGNGYDEQCYKVWLRGQL